MQATAQEEVSNSSAIVVAERLNVRSGGTNFNRVRAVTQGEALIVVGQADNCGWLSHYNAIGCRGLGVGQQPIRYAGAAVPR